MNTHPDLVIARIAQLGGIQSAHLLNHLLRQFFHPEERRGDDSLPPGRELDRLVATVDGRLPNAPNVAPFNVIPSSGVPGACCPVCLAVALGGFGSASSVRRPNFNQLSLELAAHWMLCQATNAETLVLTPDWRETTFDTRFAGLFAAYRDTGRQVFIVEVARTGLILRWPY